MPEPEDQHALNLAEFDQMIALWTDLAPTLFREYEITKSAGFSASEAMTILTAKYFSK